MVNKRSIYTIFLYRGTILHGTQMNYLYNFLYCGTLFTWCTNEICTTFLFRGTILYGLSQDYVRKKGYFKNKVVGTWYIRTIWSQLYFEYMLCFMFSDILPMSFIFRILHTSLSCSKIWSGLDFLFHLDVHLKRIKIKLSLLKMSTQSKKICGVLNAQIKDVVVDGLK